MKAHKSQSSEHNTAGSGSSIIPIQHSTKAVDDQPQDQEGEEEDDETDGGEITRHTMRVKVQMTRREAALIVSTLGNRENINRDADIALRRRIEGSSRRRRRRRLSGSSRGSWRPSLDSIPEMI